MMRSLLLTLLLLSSGCVCIAEVEAEIDFDDVAYPLSMTELLLDAEGQRLHVDEMKVVGRLEVADAGWGLAWGWIPINGVGVAGAINDQIRAAGGEAAVRVAIHAETSDFWADWNFVGAVIPLIGALPIYPTPVFVTVTGDIVRRAP